MALHSHELATNSPRQIPMALGQETVRQVWANMLVRFRRKMTVDWRESDGPVVAPLRHRGLEPLLSRALCQFGGLFERNLSPPG